MNIKGLGDQAQLNTVLYHDNSALEKIKHSIDKQDALKKVAGQFEAVFLQMVLRQMRSSSDVLADEDSPFSSQQYGVFRDMYDGQLAIEMSSKQSTGIADMLVRQLSPAIFGASTVSDGKTISESGRVSTTHALPPVLDAANDESCVIKAEARSQAHIAFNFNHCDAINNPVEKVASVNQQVNKVNVTTAFAQPLIRRMEP